MSTFLKTLLVVIFLASLQIISAQGTELKPLSVNEFEEKISSTATNEENLSTLEINSNELITLFKIKR